MAFLKTILLCALPSSVSAVSLQQRALQSQVPDEDETICSDRHRISLAQSNLHYSNLRGYGPHRTQPHGMLINKVYKHDSGQLADLLISTVQSYYPYNVSMNTITGDVASINVDAGSTVTLQLTFLDRLTAMPLAPNKTFAFTFMNFEQLTVSGCSSYELDQRTRVRATETATSLSFVSNAGKVAPTRSFDLDNEERAGAVVVRCHQPTITVEAKMREGQAGENLYITGPSNLICPKRATCASYECPEFYSPPPQQGELYCESDICSSHDIGTCCYEMSPSFCDNANMLMFPPNCVLYSNLGRQGPDFGAPEGIRYGNVFYNDRNSNGTIDMVVSATSKYVAGDKEMHKTHPGIADSRHNGLHGKYGIVTVSTGHEVWLEVSFKNNQTDEGVAINRGFFFTIYDFDQELENGGVETVTISGYDFYMVSDTTNVVVQDEGGSHHHGKFSSSVYGTEKDNPKNPRKLSTAESDKSVMFGFPENSTGFKMGLAVSPGYSARKFEFTGFSVMPCPTKGQCQSMECPPGYEHQERPLFCAQSHCSLEADLDVCCKRVDPGATGRWARCDTMVCPLDYELHVDATSRNCSRAICMADDRDKCCKKAPSSLCSDESQLVLTDIESTRMAANDKAVVRFSNVFPGKRRTRIDLEATVHNVPSGSQSSDVLVPNGNVAEIVLPSHVSTMSVDFRFVNPDSGTDSVAVPKFFLTFICSAPRRMTMQTDGLENVIVSEDTMVKLESNKSWTFGHFPARRVEYTHLFSLDEQARRSAVTLQLQATKFSIHVESIDDASSNRQSQAGDDGALLFGGASSISCRSRPSCADYTCPSGFTLRPDAGSLNCMGEACTLDDSVTCCDCDPTASLVLSPQAVTQHTLGAGSGGDKALVIANVFPYWKGHTVNLRVTSIGNYFPGNATRNGVVGPFLNLNLRTSSTTSFRFEFLGSDGSPVRVPFNFIFSAFDLDEQTDGGAREGFGISNAEYYVVSKPSLVVPMTENGASYFTSTSYGTLWDNPVNPLALTDEHLQSSVSLMMKQDVAKFNVSVKVSDGFASRNILFAGQSNLLCSKKEVCSNYRCPRGTVLVPQASLRNCLSSQCTAADEATCCRDEGVVDAEPIVGTHGAEAIPDEESA